ncbi:hypothetical protein LTR53_016833 [Teratosphaeriaceae sp. CCFEE 6253]|nr:hypothetical protein LTR53_016833 [Teratosphaeriaceae sp. CCFEE 6253]
MSHEHLALGACDFLPLVPPELSFTVKFATTIHFVQASGRPPYPFTILDDIFWNPERFLEEPRYRDTILFWRGRMPIKKEKTQLSACHLLGWNRFGRLERIIRQQSVGSEQTLISAANWDTWGAVAEHYGQEEGSWGFPEYEKALERAEQYLAYEYWFYDQEARHVKHFQPRHDEAWTKLVDSGVLRSGESYEMVCDIESVFKRAAASEDAERTLQSTTAALLTAEVAVIKSCAFQDVRDADGRRLSAAQAARDKAEAEYQSLMRRHDAITDFCQRTRAYRIANNTAEPHLLLLE